MQMVEGLRPPTLTFDLKLSTPVRLGTPCGWMVQVPAWH